MTTCIYALIDPRNLEIKYIGKTVNIRHRLSQHIYDSKRSSETKSKWIKELLNIGLTPHMVIIEEVKDGNWEEREIWWINYYREICPSLSNTDKGGTGGDGGYHLSEITKERIRQAHLGRKASESTRAKMSARRKGVKHSKEWSINIAKGRSGKKLTLEQRKTISLHNGGSKLKPDQVRRIRDLIGSGARKTDIAKEYNVNVSTIYNISKNKTYRFVE